MKSHDLRSLSPQDLAAHIGASQALLHTTLAAVRGGKEKNHQKLRELRREIARAKTIAVEGKV
jgi:ribosomal protein L29